MGPTTGEIQEKAEKLGEELLGSCRTLDEDEDHDLMELEGFADALGNVVRECECCGWWVDTHEVHDETNYCEDCQEDLDARSTGC